MTTSTISSSEPFTGRERMRGLCESFHALLGVPGTNPWDERAFAAWASGPAPTNASRQAAAFVLTVWNGHAPNDGGWWNKKPFRVGRFDPIEAVALWDQYHREAFLDWCRNPFWP